jgi:hypothetical protein
MSGICSNFVRNSPSVEIERKEAIIDLAGVREYARNVVILNMSCLEGSITES